MLLTKINTFRINNNIHHIVSSFRRNGNKRGHFMKNANTTLIKYVLLAALACSSNLLLAQPAEPQDAPRMPPREALEACKSLSVDQECSFASPHGTVKGACWAPQGKQLACKPKDAPSKESRPINQ